MMHYERVLSASCSVWLPVGVVVPVGEEVDVARMAAVSMLSGARRIQLGCEEVEFSILAAGGFEFESGWMGAGALPVASVSGVVTTDRDTTKVDGHLVRPRMNSKARRWLFSAGVDPVRLVTSLGLMRDFVVDEAGFVPVPSDKKRDLRKRILGFKE